jgi:hypothetical protein
VVANNIWNAAEAAYANREASSLMSDPTPNRRRWFQLHLSTCVVLMFVAGGLVWANVRICVRERVSVVRLGQPRGASRPSGESPEVAIPYQEFRRGWPSVFATRHIGVFPDEYEWPVDSWPGLLFNIAIGFALLSTIAFFLEYLIRRRAAAD